MPFTLRNFKEDLEDVGSRFDGAPDLEFRLATEALERIAFRTATRTRRSVVLPGPEGLETIVIGAPILGEAPREDVEGQRDWWAD